MSGAVSATAVLGPGMGLTYDFLNPKQLPKPKPPEPIKPPQAAVLPDEQARRKRAQTAAGGGGGIGSTLLTGVAGVGMDSLNLGRNTLLGQ